jgi:hypothetical protein
MVLTNPRWIFILEGIATVLVAVLAYFCLYDFPETASFLTEEERAFVVYRLKYQGNTKGSTHPQVAQTDEFKWEYVKAAFADWQVWVNIWVYWGIVCPLYGISLFLPTIIRELGYTSSTAQLLTVPIYITAAIIAIVTAYFSDKVGKRSPFIGFYLCVMAVGFIMCISASPTKTPGVIYAGVFIATVSCLVHSTLYRRLHFPFGLADCQFQTVWHLSRLPRSYNMALQQSCRQHKTGSRTSDPNWRRQPCGRNGIQLLPVQRLTALHAGSCTRACIYWMRYDCSGGARSKLYKDQQETGKGDGELGTRRNGKCGRDVEKGR